MQPRKNPPITQADKNRERLKNARELQVQKKAQQIDCMSKEELTNELKNKGLPTYGTNKEKADRLKKANGLPNNQEAAPKKSNVVSNIEAISKRREERRRKMEEERIQKEEQRIENEALGKLGDVDFELMIRQFREQIPSSNKHTPASDLKICVCVRKRPIFSKEQSNGEIDAVTCINPSVMVHETKFKVDGITKYLENHTYTYDNTFGENEDTANVYEYSLKPLCNFVLKGGTATCFAYGQTGSGKTYTMKGLQESVVRDLNTLTKGKATFHVSFFEIYGGRCFDLLNERNKLQILEDGSGNIQMQGLAEHSADSYEEVIQMIEYGHSVRTTHATTSNEDSSRSHAICTITLKQGSRYIGRLRLVDLAGSERAQDCVSNNRQRRMEGAEINKSLLALKECIRALRGEGGHVPYRGSKLTLVLRDSFEGGAEEKRVLMITCICPGHSSSDHTLNSLRYADRLKEQSTSNVVKAFQPKPEPREAREPREPREAKEPKQPKQENRPEPKNPRPEPKPANRPEPKKNPPKSLPKNQNRKSPGKSRKDMEYIQQHAGEDKMSRELLDFHEKVETILEEEEELLETHVNAIKEDAKILTEEGELIAMAQGEGYDDYDIDAYVQRMEVLVKHKLTVYENLYKKLISFKSHLNEEEEFSHHLSQNFRK